MEINDIKIFYEVANLNSTVKAANKMGYVQSNISKRIARLENEIGRNLFYRTNKGMTLTTEGELFLVYAIKILSAVSEMEDKFLNINKQVRIGATQTISRNYLQKQYLNKNIVIFTKSTSDLITQLKDSYIDFIITNKKLDNLEFKEVKFMDEKIFWAKSKNNKKEFLENKIIISRDIECPYRKETLNYLNENNLKNISIVEVDTIDILIMILQKNEAIAILPEAIIVSNDELEAVINQSYKNVTIRVYSLKSTNIKFEVELF